MINDVTEILLVSLRVSAVATVVAAALGLPLGWLLATSQIPFRRLIGTLVLLPMVLPPVAIGLVLLALCGPSGPLGKIWTMIFGTPLLLTWQVAALAAAVVAFPIAVKSSESAFAGVPERLCTYARVRGLGASKIFWTIQLPLARRSLLAGFVLVFARALGEFGATSIVAGIISGETETLAQGIWVRILNGQTQEAWILASVSALLGTTAVIIAMTLEPPREART